MGEFLNCIHAQKNWYIDPNSENRKHLDKDIEFYSTSAERLTMINTESIDSVFVSNFFEHLPDKKSMDLVLNEIHRVLKPDNKFLILQPNISFAYDLYWDFYDHHTTISNRSKSEALQKNKFQVKIMILRFVTFSTKSALPKNPFFVKIYLKIQILWRFLGKQFFVLAVK